MRIVLFGHLEFCCSQLASGCLLQSDSCEEADVFVLALEKMSVEIIVAGDRLDLVSSCYRCYFLSECFYVNIDAGKVMCLFM